MTFALERDVDQFPVVVEERLVLARLGAGVAVACHAAAAQHKARREKRPDPRTTRWAQVSSATATAGSPASRAITSVPARSRRSRVARTAGPGVGVRYSGCTYPATWPWRQPPPPWPPAASRPTAAPSPRVCRRWSTERALFGGPADHSMRGGRMAAHSGLPLWSVRPRRPTSSPWPIALTRISKGMHSSRPPCPTTER
jgi:hypothetical protein